MRRAALISVSVGLLIGCTTSTIPITSPESGRSFGSIHTLAVDSTTAAAQVIDHAEVSGLLHRTVPVAIAIHPVVEQRVRARLQRLGYQLCAPAPCGDGVMHITLQESQLNQHDGPRGPSATAHVVAHVQVFTNAGQNPYDFTFTRDERGNIGGEERLVGLVSEEIADGIEASLVPKYHRLWYTVDDTGELHAGVTMLVASDFDGAIRYFQTSVARDPANAGGWFDLGTAWEAKRVWPEAAKAYEQAAILKSIGRYVHAARIARENVEQGR